jgi:hypothetical protein
LVSDSELERQAHFLVSSNGSHIVTSENVIVSTKSLLTSTHVPAVTSTETREGNGVLENVEWIVSPVESFSSITSSVSGIVVGSDVSSDTVRTTIKIDGSTGGGTIYSCGTNGGGISDLFS